MYCGVSASHFRTEAEPSFEKRLIFEITMLTAKITTPHCAECKQMSLLSVLRDQGPGCLVEIGLSALGTVISFITSVLNEVGKCVRFFFFLNEKLRQRI